MTEEQFEKLMQAMPDEDVIIDRVNSEISTAAINLSNEIDDLKALLYEVLRRLPEQDDPDADLDY
jgi:hypothetical protein